MDTNDIIGSFISFINDMIFDPISSFLKSIVSFALDNPMFKIILAFVPIILSISYPLLIQSIGKLNDEYRSTHIYEQFSKEKTIKLFKYLLWSSVIFTFLCFTISNWILILAFLSTSLLLYMFSRYLQLVKIYQSGKTLFAHLKRRIIRHKKTESQILKFEIPNTNRLLSKWYSIIDLLKYAIRNGDRKLEDDIALDFIYPVYNFFKITSTEKNRIIIYPNILLNSTYDIIVTYLNAPNIDYYQKYDQYIGSIFFPYYYNKSERRFIGPEIYKAIWRNLNLLIRHDVSDKILRYWEAAHQYYRFDLLSVYFSDREQETKGIKKIQNDIEKNRHSFFQFHTVLCANILYSNQYTALKKFWYFTQSQPPEYPLVLYSIDDIFNIYAEFTEERMPSSSYVIEYYFNELDFESFSNEPDARYYIRRYCVLMLIKRQFEASEGDKIKNIPLPKIPESQTSKQDWIRRLSEIKAFISDICSDENLIKDLGFELSNLPKVKERINEYIDDLEKELNQQFSDTLKGSVLEENIIESFKTASVKSIKSVYDKFKRIGQNNVNESERDQISNKLKVIRGTEMLVDREAFIENTTTHYINAESIIGELIANDYQRHISNKFYSNCSKRIIVKSEETFKAIDKLSLDSEVCVLVMFGKHLEYYRDHLNIPIEVGDNDADFKYKGLSIYSFLGVNPIVSDICFVLKKSDLPMIRHIDWKDESITNQTNHEYWSKFGEPLDDELFIYARLFDLEKEDELLEEYDKKNGVKQASSPKVLLRVDFLAYCWFKNRVKIWSIQESRPFQEGGNITPLENIPEF